MTAYEAEKQRVATAHAQFPTVFGLSAFPGEQFRLAPVSTCFVSEGQVQLVVQILKDGTWLDFGRNTPEHIKARMVTLADPRFVNVTLPVPLQTLRDLLCTAVEGGSNYWAHFTKPVVINGEYDQVNVLELEPSGNTLINRVVTARDLAVGIERLAKAAATGTFEDGTDFPAAGKHLYDALGDHDATTADVVLQMTVFNDIVYS